MPFFQIVAGLFYGYLANKALSENKIAPWGQDFDMRFLTWILMAIAVAFLIAAGAGLIQ